MPRQNEIREKRKGGGSETYDEEDKEWMKFSQNLGGPQKGILSRLAISLTREREEGAVKNERRGESAGSKRPRSRN